MVEAKTYIVKKPVEAVQFQGLNKDFEEWFSNNFPNYGFGNSSDDWVDILDGEGSVYLLRIGSWVVKNCSGSFQIVQDDMFKINYQEYKED